MQLQVPPAIKSTFNFQILMPTNYLINKSKKIDQVFTNTILLVKKFKYFHHGAISINDEFVHILSKQI